MNQRTCETKGCGKPYYSKGLCRTEYEDRLKQRHAEGTVPARTTNLLSCLMCEQPFKATARQVARAADGRDVFDSIECRRAYQAARAVTANCQTCGKQVTRPPSKALERIFCSLACRTGEGVGKARQGTTAPCGYCGEPVYRIAALSAEGKERFCDMEHKAAWMRGQERVERPEKPCEVCGTVMRLTPDDVSHGRRFCSKQCVDEHRRVPVGHRWIDETGYAWIHVEDEAGRRRRILEHRWVMEQQIGRPLFSWETVHHLTGGFLGRSNNDLSNLELWAGRHVRGHRAEDIVAYCREMLALYGDEGEQAQYAEHLASLSDTDAATDVTDEEVAV